MNWKRLAAIAAAGTILAVMGAGGALGHEAHRRAQSAPAEADEEQRAPEPVEAANDESEAEQEPVSATSPEPLATEHSHDPKSPPAPAEPPPEPVSFLFWLGRLHPMAIHFPIALFIAALAAEILLATTREEFFRHAVRFCLWGGASSAAAAAPLGWLLAASGATEEGWILEAHRWAGTAALLLGGAVLWISERSERSGGNRLLLRVSLALQAALVGSAGFLGGSLLYGIDHLWRGIWT